MGAVMDNPFSGASFGEWLGGITAGLGAVYVAYKKWARAEHAEDRREGAEDRRDGAYDEVIAIMRQQIKESTLDRSQMWQQLSQCEGQHADCRKEMAVMRQRVDQLEKGNSPTKGTS